MKFFAISDTHCFHRQVMIPNNIDCIIHAGDSTNSYWLNDNLQEFEDFLDWYEHLNISYKILIAGNHDAWATKLWCREKVKEKGIIYLENEYYDLNGLKIFGSPWVPTYGNWYFMKDRSKLDDIWKHLDNDIDILITHGPPQGILDVTEERDYTIKQAGDSALYKRVFEKRPKYHVFGHIHDFKTCRNFGSLKRDFGTTFMNVSSVEDGKFDKGLIHNGIVFEI